MDFDEVTLHKYLSKFMFDVIGFTDGVANKETVDVIDLLEQMTVCLLELIGEDDLIDDKE